MDLLKVDPSKIQAMTRQPRHRPLCGPSGPGEVPCAASLPEPRWSRTISPRVQRTTARSRSPTVIDMGLRALTAMMTGAWNMHASQTRGCVNSSGRLGHGRATPDSRAGSTSVHDAMPGPSRPLHIRASTHCCRSRNGGGDPSPAPRTHLMEVVCPSSSKSNRWTSRFGTRLAAIIRTRLLRVATR